MHLNIFGNSIEDIDNNIITRIKKNKGDLNLKQKLIALDGGANTLLKYDIVPDVIIGDLDSLIRDSTFYKAIDAHKVEIIHSIDQEITDAEKALVYAVKNDIKSIYMYNCLGGARLDHNMHNIRLLEKFYNKNKLIELFDTKQKILFVKDAYITIIGDIGMNIAVMSMYKARVTSVGLKYDMSNMKLNACKACDSVANSLAIEVAKVNVVGSAIIVVDIDGTIMYED